MGGCLEAKSSSAQPLKRNAAATTAWRYCLKHFKYV